jgi:drug/metabolite transporter (DMT)-like permease
MKMSLLYIILLIIATSACDTVSQLFLKNSINSLSFNINGIRKLLGFLLRLALVPRVWFALSFSTLSLFIWLFVLSKADLNLAFSLDSMHYIFIAFGSHVILKEKVGLKRWGGTLLIVIGIVLVSFTGRA